MSKENFNEWFSNALGEKMRNLPYNRDSLIKDAWNHQQKKIDALEEQNKDFQKDRIEFLLRLHKKRANTISKLIGKIQKLYRILDLLEEFVIVIYRGGYTGASFLAGNCLDELKELKD